MPTLKGQKKNLQTFFICVFLAEKYRFDLKKFDLEKIKKNGEKNQ
jgi:hypothetical protein